jgi:hypothetical protein
LNMQDLKIFWLALSEARFKVDDVLNTLQA